MLYLDNLPQMIPVTSKKIARAIGRRIFTVLDQYVSLVKI